MISKFAQICQNAFDMTKNQNAFDMTLHSQAFNKHNAANHV